MTKRLSEKVQDDADRAYRNMEYAVEVRKKAIRATKNRRRTRTGEAER